jgi:SnoaL-like domain
MPPDANVVKDLMKQNLLGVFSERDAVKRRSLIVKIWDAKAVFIDPEGRYVGHTAINGAVEKLQHRFPDFAFSVLAAGDANSGVGRLPWGFGPLGEPRKITGIDVLVASDDGRITALYTFADTVNK